MSKMEELISFIESLSNEEAELILSYLEGRVKSS